MTPGPMLPHKEEQWLNDIELLLGQSDIGLTSTQLEEALGIDVEVIDVLLWRTGRSRGLLYDGHFWRYGSAGDANPPVLGHSLPRGVRYGAGWSLTTHDPLCPDASLTGGGCVPACESCDDCQCDLIAKVRKDTLRQACLMIENIFGSAPSIFPTDDEAIRYVQGNLRSLAYPMGSGRP